MISIPPVTARRLAIVKQRLGRDRASATAAGIKDVARSIRCIQVDPIRAVERTQYLVLHSRLGSYDPEVFDRLVWEERFFFHYWAHAASLVLTEDLPIFKHRMRHWIDPNSVWDGRVATWMEDNRSLRTHVLRQLKRHGALRVRDLEDRSVKSWGSTGWNAARNVDRMLEFLWAQGKTMVVGRVGLERVWGLASEWLPPVEPSERLTLRQATELAVEHSLRALGVATPRQIRAHFTRDGYPELPKVLASMERKGVITPVSVEGMKGKWFIHRDDVSVLDDLDEASTPRTVLLSPFDNLICDRARTEALWDFRYRIEIYVPRDQRVYGYYALPILHGDGLIGRVDATTDRKRNVLRVDAIHMEDSAPRSRDTGAAIVGALSELSDFVAEGNLELPPSAAPPGWKRFLRGA